MRKNIYLFLNLSMNITWRSSLVMLKKILALFKFQINITLSNKFFLVYTLLLPAVNLFLALSKRGIGLDAQEKFVFLTPYISYIIVIAMLFGWAGNIVSLRENNYLKVFSSLTGSKFYIFAVQTSDRAFECIVIKKEKLGELLEQKSMTKDSRYFFYFAKEK